MPLRAELDARHDHRAVFANESIDEGHRVDRVLVAEETDRARRRWRPVQDARVARGPILEERPPFVDEKPRALEELLAALERDLGEREDLAGRVIRLTDAYDLRARVDCGGERVEIDGPRALLAEPDLAHTRAKRGRDAMHLHVVRHHDDDLVARADKRREREEVRFARTGRDHDVVRVVALVNPRDERARGFAAHTLGVSQ